MAALALVALPQALAAPGPLAPRTQDRRSFSHVAQSVRATPRFTAFFKLGGQNAESAGIFASQGRDDYSEDDVAHVSRAPGIVALSSGLQGLAAEATEARAEDTGQGAAPVTNRTPCVHLQAGEGHLHAPPRGTQQSTVYVRHNGNASRGNTV